MDVLFKSENDGKKWFWRHEGIEQRACQRVAWVNTCPDQDILWKEEYGFREIELSKTNFIRMTIV